MAIQEAEYLRLDALAARGSASARETFLRAMRTGLASADTNKLRLAIQHGDGAFAVDAVNWIQIEVDLSRMFTTGDGDFAGGVGPLAQAASRLAREAVGPGIDVAVTNRALAGLADHAGSRVRRIGDETRAGLRALVEAGFDESRDFGEVEADVQALLRSDGGFGLDERSAGAIARREAAMRDAGVPRRDRDRIVRKLKIEALQRRARLVALTELQDLGNEAMLATWREAERESGATIWKIWRTRGAEACPRCDALADQRRRLDEQFSGIDGDAPMRPLLHPHCYCWLDMVYEDGASEDRVGGTSRAVVSQPSVPLPRAAASTARAIQREAQRSARARRADRSARRAAAPPVAATRRRAIQNSPQVTSAEAATQAAVALAQRIARAWPSLTFASPAAEARARGAAERARAWDDLPPELRAQIEDAERRRATV